MCAPRIKAAPVIVVACSSTPALPTSIEGVTWCANALRIRMEAVDTTVLASIGDILDGDLVDDVIARVRELLEIPNGFDALRDRLATDMSIVDREIAKPDGWHCDRA